MSLVPMNVCFRADCVAKLGGHLLIGLVGKFEGAAPVRADLF
jgi:hypothetical protein